MASGALSIMASGVMVGAAAGAHAAAASITASNPPNSTTRFDMVILLK
jgi:hypothetical protein